MSIAQHTTWKHSNCAQPGNCNCAYWQYVCWPTQIIHTHTHINIKSQGKSVLHNAAQKMLFTDHKAYLQTLCISSLEVSSRHKTVHICQWAENGLLWYQHVWRWGKMNTHIYISNCPLRCNTKQSLYYPASSLWMFWGVNHTDYQYTKM
jgi:hypothetical protein